jgi:hypothetical protein
MAIESDRPRLAVTAVLLAAIGAAVYVLAPLARRSGGLERVGDDELWDAVEALRDRMDELSDQVMALQEQLPEGREG